MVSLLILLLVLVFSGAYLPLQASTPELPVIISNLSISDGFYSIEEAMGHLEEERQLLERDYSMIQAQEGAERAQLSRKLARERNKVETARERFNRYDQEIATVDPDTEERRLLESRLTRAKNSLDKAEMRYADREFRWTANLNKKYDRRYQTYLRQISSLNRRAERLLEYKQNGLVGVDIKTSSRKSMIQKDLEKFDDSSHSNQDN